MSTSWQWDVLAVHSGCVQLPTAQAELLAHVNIAQIVGNALCITRGGFLTSPAFGYAVAACQQLGNGMS